MNNLTLLRFWLLAAFFLGACGIPTIPSLIPADTPTPTPVPTPPPAVGLEVPTSGGRWQVTVDSARRETQLTVGFYPDTKTYTPKSGYLYLAVDFNFRSLDPSHQSGVPSEAISIIGANGEISTAVGLGGFGDTFVCVAINLRRDTLVGCNGCEIVN